MPGDEDAAAYMRRSTICAEIAQQISNPDIKLELLSMAQAWLRLAEQATSKQVIVITKRPEGPSEG